MASDIIDPGLDIGPEELEERSSAAMEDGDVTANIVDEPFFKDQIDCTKPQGKNRTSSKIDE